MNRKTISLKVNGQEREVDVEARVTLLDMIRDQLGLTGAKLGVAISRLRRLHFATRRQTRERLLGLGRGHRWLRYFDDRRLG